MNPRIALYLLLAAAAGAVPAQAQDAGTLKKVKESGSITLGIRESSYPLSYLDDRQQPVGYHIDVCNRIVDAVKSQLKLPALKVQHQAVTSQNRIPLVSNGTVDLECGSTTNNEARQKQVAFAPTTFVTNVRMAVKKASGITSLGQLGGKPVATTTGTTSVQLMRAHEKGKGIDFKEVYGKDHADSFLMLETDRAVAIVSRAITSRHGTEEASSHEPKSILSPCSAAVPTPGRDASRCALVTAMPLSLPPWIWLTTPAGVVMKMSTCPAIRSCTAGPEPR